MISTRLLAVVTAANALLMVLAWTGQDAQPQAPEVIRAQAIQLVDAAGVVRGELHLGADGGGQIRLRDGRGIVAVKLGSLREGGGALLLMDRTPEPAIELAPRDTGAMMTLRRGGRSQGMEP